MKKKYFLTPVIAIQLISFCFFANAQNPSQDGQWSDPIPFGIVPVAVANLPDGRLITWSSQFRDTYVNPSDGATFTEIFDPNIGPDGAALGETVSNTDHDMFCPGINNLADGRILSAGGASSYRTSIYDPTTGIWSVADEMNVPRGYQGNVTLADGSVFTLGGSWDSGPDGLKDAEQWTEATGWVMLPGIKGDNIYTANDLNTEAEGVYRADNHLWLWPAPNGKLFHAGPSEMMHWIDVDNGGSIVNAGLRGDGYSMKGTTVMFDIGKILKVGGAPSYGSNHPARNTTYVIDIENTPYGTNPTVTYAGALAYSRTMHNSTVLPNGEVLVTGGLDHAEVFSDVGSRLTAEMYNPNTGWRSVAGMVTPRTYHSVAILMTDGRVFVGGGGLCDNSNPTECVNHMDAEIYSPPYLFDSGGNLAVRPVINAPSTADYNTSISVTGDVGIQEFSLIRFSAATHSTNNEQRRIPLSFTGNGTYSVSIPDRNLLPPGYYMLFAMNAAGVPSVAETIQVGNSIPLQNNPSLVLDLKFDETTGSIASDDSQYGNDASLYDVDNAGATKVASTDNWGTGLFGGALQTDGFKFQSNTTAEVQNSPSMATLNRFITVMAWVNRDEIVNNASIFSHDYPSLFFGFHNSLYKWEFSTDDNQTSSCYSGYSPTGQWVHIAATYDGQTARLYANGVEICSKPISGNLVINTTEPNFSSFTASGFYEPLANPAPGYNGSGVTDELDGRIDELKVYNKALSAAEIKTFFELGQGLPGASDCPLGVITAEFKVGNGAWTEGANINVPEGEEVYIRAKNFVGEYFVTTAEIDGNTFSSFADFDQNIGYRIDTGTASGDNDGMVDLDDIGQYVLTTSNGCPATINLNVVGSCDPGDVPITTEFRINGDWNTPNNGATSLTLEAGTELIVSILPNEVNGNTFKFTITLPNGIVVSNDYNLGSITNEDEGIYIITSSEGCSITFELVVTDVDCGAIGLVPEYRINTEPWVQGASSLNIVEGSQLSLSIFPDNLLYSITGPNGFFENVGTGDFIIDNIAPTQDGVYTFTTAGGCSVNLDVNVDAICTGLVSEYRINSEAWVQGSAQVTIDEGSQLTLSMAPNDQAYTITGPNGFFENVGIGDFTIPMVDGTNDGIYIFTSIDTGCTVELEVIVIPLDCNTVLSEYRINFQPWVQDATQVTIDSGSRLMLSISPDNLAYTISGPNGLNVPEAFGDYTIETISENDSGTYTFTTSITGCTLDLEVVVNPVICNSILTEYQINGTPWVQGASEVTVDIGAVLNLSIFPNNLPYNIDGPNGLMVGNILGDYTIPSVDFTNAGTYIFTTVGTGCSKSLLVNVNNPACTALGLIPEYSINGAEFVSGTNGGNLTLEAGNSLVLSALPNTLNGNSVPLTITIPDGSVQADNYEITSLTVDDSGTYLFTTDTGCTTTLQVFVNPGGVDCSALNLIPEFSVNGAAFELGTNGGVLNLDVGSSLVLSASPDTFNGLNVPVTITLPDTSFESDNYSIASVDVTDSGTYVFTTDTGCLTTLQLVVNSGSNCDQNGITPTYAINGAAPQSNPTSMLLAVGDNLELGIEENTILFTITLPNGVVVDGDYSIQDIQMDQAGVYTFSTLEGCSNVLTVTVQEDSTSGDLEDIIVYPNPVSDGMLYLDLKNHMGKMITVQLYDIYGKSLLQKIFPVDHLEQEQIDFSNVSDGTYLLLIGNLGAKSKYKKIIKLRG